MAYVYTKLAGPFQDRAKYNVFGVVDSIRREISRPKGKLFIKFSIIDETRRTPFLVSVFCKTTDENIPDISIGSIVRLHRMKAEAFHDFFDGRIFSSNDLVVFPKETVSHRVWKSEAKNVTLTDSDWNRVNELMELAEVVVLLGNLPIDLMEFDSTEGSSAIAMNEEPLQEENQLNTSTSDQSMNKDCPSHPDDLSNFKLAMNPSLEDLRTKEKDLLVWQCICQREYRTSQLIWIDGPKNLGSTKCPHCGVIGMALPRFEFEMCSSFHSMTCRRILSGEFACQFLETSLLDYAFNDEKSQFVNRKLSTM